MDIPQFDLTDVHGLTLYTLPAPEHDL